MNTKQKLDKLFHTAISFFVYVSIFFVMINLGLANMNLVKLTEEIEQLRIENKLLSDEVAMANDSLSKLTRSMIIIRKLIEETEEDY